MLFLGWFDVPTARSVCATRQLKERRASNSGNGKVGLTEEESSDFANQVDDQGPQGRFQFTSQDCSWYGRTASHHVREKDPAMNRTTFPLRTLVLISLFVSGASAAPKAPDARPGDAQPADAPRLSENALKHFNAGVAYADDPSGPKWEEAYREFLAAYADTPSWILKNNIGLCALNLERDDEAIAAFKIYLEHGGEPGLSAKHRKQIETDIETLSASLVRIEIQAEPAQLTLVDERKNSKGVMVSNSYPVGDGKVTIGIHPGRHRIVAEAPGYISDEWNFEAPPASSHNHAFKLALAKKPEKVDTMVKRPVGPAVTQPPQAETSRTPTAVYVGLAATGAFAAAATVTGLITLSKEKDYENAPTDAEADSIAKTGKTLRLITDIEIGAAILSAGATAYFYFTAPKQGLAQSATHSRDKLQLTPIASPSSAGLSVTGTF